MAETWCTGEIMYVYSQIRAQPRKIFLYCQHANGILSCTVGWSWLGEVVMSLHTVNKNKHGIMGVMVYSSGINPLPDMQRSFFFLIWNGFQKSRHTHLPWYLCAAGVIYDCAPRNLCWVRRYFHAVGFIVFHHWGKNVLRNVNWNGTWLAVQAVWPCHNKIMWIAVF